MTKPLCQKVKQDNENQNIYQFTDGTYIRLATNLAFLTSRRKSDDKEPYRYFVVWTSPVLRGYRRQMRLSSESKEEFLKDLSLFLHCLGIDKFIPYRSSSLFAPHHPKVNIDRNSQGRLYGDYVPNPATRRLLGKRYKTTRITSKHIEDESELMDYICTVYEQLELAERSDLSLLSATIDNVLTIHNEIPKERTQESNMFYVGRMSGSNSKGHVQRILDDELIKRGYPR